MVFCDFCGARATLCGNRRGRGAKTQGFLRLLLFELVLGSCLVVRAPAPGTGGSRVRFLPGPRVARCNLHFTATCAEQLAQSKLHRATCADQLAPTSLRRAPCLEQLAQSNLRRATCTEQLAQSSLHRATCREQLAGATCAEQLAQSNLHSATCVEQLAQTNLHRPVCAEHLAWCCLALASRSVGKKNASCSVGPTSLAMFCFRANRGLVLLRFSWCPFRTSNFLVAPSDKSPMCHGRQKLSSNPRPSTRLLIAFPVRARNRRSKAPAPPGCPVLCTPPSKQRQ